MTSPSKSAGRIRVAIPFVAPFASAASNRIIHLLTWEAPMRFRRSRFVRFLLEWHLDAGGSLFYPDSDDPYTPDDLPNMKTKRKPKFRVFGGRCPKCGGSDVQLDLTAAENLQRVPLSAVTSSILPGMGTPVRLRCTKCNAKFLG